MIKDILCWFGAALLGAIILVVALEILLSANVGNVLGGNWWR